MCDRKLFNDGYVPVKEGYQPKVTPDNTSTVEPDIAPNAGHVPISSGGEEAEPPGDE